MTPSFARNPVGPRVISLLPSATEMVCAVDAADLLVGISHECDFPETIRDRPVLTRSRIEVTGSSQSIDRAVRGVIRDALSIYAVDDGRLGSLAPDLIITQDLCEVCAVSLDDVRSAVARLAHRKDVRLVSLRPTRLGDVLGDIERVAEALGRKETGRTVRSALQQRIDAIRDRARQATHRPRVVSLEWIDPLMIGGTWMPEIIELAGGEAAGAAAGAPAPTVSSSELRALFPDVVVVKPCGFSMERTLSEMEVVRKSVLAPLPRQARVYITDGSAFFNRPGPRLVESLEIMAACVHPGLFEAFADKHKAVIRRVD